MLSTRTLGMGGHARGRAGTLPERPRSSGSTGTRRRSRSRGSASSRYADRFTVVHAVYDEFADVVHDLGLPAGARRPVRPRRLLAAARRGRPRVRLPPRRAAGHADGPELAASPRPTSSTPTTPPSSSGSCASTARSGSPAAIAAAIVRERQREPFTTSARLVELLKRAGPGRLAEERRPPGQAHLPGAADRGQRRAARPGRRPCPPPVDDARGRRPRSRSSATTRWRTGSPSASSPAGARSSPPEACRSSCPSTRHTCGCSRAGPRSPARRSRTANPRAASARLRAAERTRATKGQHDEPVTAPAESDHGPPAPRHHRPAPAGRPRTRRAPRGSGLFAARACCCSSAGLMGLLLLNTSMADGSFALHDCRPPPVS